MKVGLDLRLYPIMCIFRAGSELECFHLAAVGIASKKIVNVEVLHGGGRTRVLL